jgi:hypothetical protein
MYRNQHFFYRLISNYDAPLRSKAKKIQFFDSSSGQTAMSWNGYGHQGSFQGGGGGGRGAGGNTSFRGGFASQQVTAFK